MTTTLTAAVQGAYARVLLQLTFTTVSSATVSRVHADGTVWPVRGAEPTSVSSSTGVGWVGYDHEAPLDQAVTYRATSTQDPAVVTSAAVTVPSGGKAWLTHPLNPAVGGAVPVVRDLGDTTYEARGSVLAIIGRREPIAMTDVELAGAGSITVQTATAAQVAVLRALTADGGVLLLRLPAAWDVEPWLYIRRGPITLQRWVPIAGRPERRYVIPYTQVARPAGVSAGAVGVTYNTILDTYATYNALAAGKATYNAMSI